MVSDESIVKISAIIGLTAICVVALAHGIDSVLTASISAIMGGIAGYEIGINREKKNSKL